MPPEAPRTHDAANQYRNPPSLAFVVPGRFVEPGRAIGDRPQNSPSKNFSASAFFRLTEPRQRS